MTRAHEYRRAHAPRGGARGIALSPLALAVLLQAFVIGGAPPAAAQIFHLQAGTSTLSQAHGAVPTAHGRVLEPEIRRRAAAEDERSLCLETHHLRSVR